MIAVCAWTRRGFRISYYDYTNKDLKYAYQDSIGWHIETIDAEGEVGEFPSLFLFWGVAPSVSYFDRTNGDLRLASQETDLDLWNVYLPVVLK